MQAFGAWLASGRLEEAHLHRPAAPPPEASVQRDGGDVVIVGVEERRLSAPDDRLGDQAGQACRIAASPEIRMDADGADLGVAREAQALAGHGGQTPALPHADELAHPMRLPEERS